MFRAGKTYINNGASTVSVAFGATFSAAPTTVIGTVSNTAGGSYFLLYPTVVAVSTTGCTFEFNGAADSGNYSISWIATDDNTVTSGGGATGATGPTGATGSSSIPAKPINRLSESLSVAGSDYIVMQSTSGGLPVTARISLDTLKNFVNS